MTASTDQLKIGSEFLGKYQVLSSLGKGSMGLVFKAKHKLMDRLVAIKTLIYAGRNDEHRKELFHRFHQEARAASALSHPNLVSIYDFGTLEDGNAYAVMDYVDGKTLSEVINETGHVPYQEAVEIFMQICAGLDHAHQKGIVHRDIKPSNIMIARTAAGAIVAKVVDFGIAKLMPSAQVDKKNSLTDADHVLGSPLYMSPEQCQHKPLDHRTDIYSLGCTMYKALTGVAFAKDQMLVGVLNKHVNETPAPFSKVAPDIEIPRELEAVVMRALAKHPDERFRSMADMLKALRKVAGPSATAGGVAGPTIRVLIADGHPSDAKAIKTALSKQADFEVVDVANDGEDAIDKLLQSQPQVVVMDLHLDRLSGTEVVRHIKQTFGSIKVIGMTREHESEKVLAAFGAGIDGYCIKRTGYDNLSAAIRAVVYGGTWIDPEVAGGFLRACAHASEQIAEETYEKTQEIVQMQELDPGMFLSILGETYQSENKTFEAQTLYEAAILLTERNNGPACPSLCGPLTKLADLYFEQGKSDEAQELYLRALALRHRGTDVKMDVPAILQRLSTVSGGAESLQERIRKTMAALPPVQP